MENKFDFQVKKISEDKKWKYRAVSQLVSDWDRLVSTIHEYGYNDCLSEYDNDIWVRQQIEELLTEQKLQDFMELVEFKAAVSEIDERLKTLFIPGIKRTDTNLWWEQGVLKNGTGYYLEDVTNLKITGSIK